MAQILLASNTSAVFIRTQSVIGEFADPTNTEEDGSGDPTGIYAVRVVGTPKFTPRGAGIIQRTDIYTPWGAGQSARTGGIGWDISFQTEFFWRFNQAAGSAAQYITRNTSQLSALWLASPWDIDVENGYLLTVQPFFAADTGRDANPPVTVPPTPAQATYSAQPFSIVYEETNGKRYEAQDCLCIPKFSWESGGKIMIDWTIKGIWRNVTDSTNQTPVYPEAYVPAMPQPPLIGQSASLALTNFFGANTNALSKVAIDTGWSISDVMDTRQQYGFGLAFVALNTYPTITLDVANFSEDVEPDWTDAQSNKINSNDLVVEITVPSGSAAVYTITCTMTNPQLIEWPTPGDVNGYRNITLKFGGVPTYASGNDRTRVMSFLFDVN